tara:strand:+ start:725 stop:934 length:210 start_codon:yes stop_codon:yes gene_type:complete
MKYLLFAWDAYYPAGGLADLHSVYATKEEAIAYAKGMTENDGADYTAIYTIDDIKEIVTEMATKQEENK